MRRRNKKDFDFGFSFILNGGMIKSDPFETGYLVCNEIISSYKRNCNFISDEVAQIRSVGYANLLHAAYLIMPQEKREEYSQMYAFTSIYIKRYNHLTDEGLEKRNSGFLERLEKDIDLKDPLLEKLLGIFDNPDVPAWVNNEYLKNTEDLLSLARDIWDKEGEELFAWMKSVHDAPRKKFWYF